MLVEAIEIRELGGIVTDRVPLSHSVVPPGTVHVNAVFALPTRRVNVRESVSPGATLRDTESPLAVRVAFGVKELTLFSLALAFN